MISRSIYLLLIELIYTIIKLFQNDFQIDTGKYHLDCLFFYNVKTTMREDNKRDSGKINK